MARELGLSVDLLQDINRDLIPLHPYYKGIRVCFLRSDVPSIVQRIYFADHKFRPGTLAKILNTVAGVNRLTKNSFRRVNGRWVLR